MKNKRCKNHHLLFIPLSNGHYNAVDTWCGHTVEERTWYCSKECLERGKEGIPLTYKNSDDEPIMND